MDLKGCECTKIGLMGTFHKGEIFEYKGNFYMMCSDDSFKHYKRDKASGEDKEVKYLALDIENGTLVDLSDECEEYALVLNAKLEIDLKKD